ncbi:J domain-containing protein [Chitinophaga niabensis]|uniref:DnaJ domain-containing protein n=1 Tax=Chitinophaga niabensis TaxID=536979 RepID=A0A1N6J198_9BACT|nr:J domain-containing protein [Chitinophaga niabensis]SIO38033.1 DnaJ domain-containing protein [Chitinophaga niabensis]
MHNYYTILGIADFSGAEEIKAAHRRLSKRYHPDLNNGNKLYEERFREIQHAYEQLRDPLTKERHDNRLRYSYAAKNTFIEPEPVVVQPDTAVIKWRRSRGAAIACLILLPLFARVLFSKPWEANARVQETFTVGSEREAVLNAQGKPHWTTKQGSVEMWAYGKSFVIFQDGTVSNYLNLDSNLHISAAASYE